MVGHGPGGTASVGGEECLDDGQMFLRFFMQAAVIIARFLALPGDVAERAEEGLEPAEFLSEKGIAARRGDEVVQAVIKGSGPGDEIGTRRRTETTQPAQVVGESMQFGQVDPPAGVAGSGAFEDSADLTDFLDVACADLSDNGAAIRLQVNDADAGQGDERFADRSVADAEALGELLGSQMGARPQASLKDVAQEGLDDGLTS